MTYEKIIAAALHDVYDARGASCSNHLRRTLCRVRRRLNHEGISFLTKTMPRLGKAFDKALLRGSYCLPSDMRCKAMSGAQLPRFLGELYSEIFGPDGAVLRDSRAETVRELRQLFYLFYKYELPYSEDEEQAVLAKFIETELGLQQVSSNLESIRNRLSSERGLRDSAKYTTRRVYLRARAQGWGEYKPSQLDVIHVARIFLEEALQYFDPKNISPRHGPGVVATKQRLWDKYHWTNVSDRITAYYPFDEYFCSSVGSVCDRYPDFDQVTSLDLPARVLLVPKDSRGPRLISCEPVDYQWVQQGLGRALVSYVESHELTKFNVFFTNQQPNQFGALLGSSTGQYSTLDLNEASDRVSVSLVHLLYPDRICEALDACRSSSTVLPCGKVLKLLKFAPMGSSLCFPIMALTIWAILTAAAPDLETRESILVYGDDVVVPTAYAVDAIEQLESFGLKINRDKSCTSGFFRESCGTDAFKGVNVTPVRLRTVWSSSQSPESYASWISYANSFWARRMYSTYDYIVGELFRLYGRVPDKSMVGNTCPSLEYVPIEYRPTKWRINHDLQRKEWRVRSISSVTINHISSGWDMLLRYFANSTPEAAGVIDHRRARSFDPVPAFRVGSYTQPHASKLVYRWRCKIGKE